MDTGAEGAGGSQQGEGEPTLKEIMSQIKGVAASVAGMTGMEARLGLRLTGLEVQAQTTSDKVDTLEVRVSENEARFPDAVLRVVGPELDKMRNIPRREDDPRTAERY